MPRLFTGLEIPAEIGQELSGYRGGLPGARWIDPENYHITLRFIGDVDHSLARDVFSLLGDGHPRSRRRSVCRYPVGPLGAQPPRPRKPAKRRPALLRARRHARHVGH
jgi:hypothetical protein